MTQLQKIVFNDFPSGTAETSIISVGKITPRQLILKTKPCIAATDYKIYIKRDQNAAYDIDPIITLDTEDQVTEIYNFPTGETDTFLQFKLETANDTTASEPELVLIYQPIDLEARAHQSNAPAFTFDISGLINPINIPGGLVFRGVYDNGTNYDVGDCVTYDTGTKTNTYVMYLNAIAGNLPTDETYWQLLAEQGDPGPTLTVNLVSQIGGNITLTPDNINDDTSTHKFTSAAAIANQAKLDAANEFSNTAPLKTAAESWIGPSATAGIYFKAGNIGFGTITPLFPLDLKSNNMRVFNAGNANTLFFIDRFSTVATRYPYFALRKSHSDTENIWATTVTDEYLGALNIYGVNSAATPAVHGAASIIFRQDGPATGTCVPCRIEFYTADTGAPALRAVLKGNGHFGFGVPIPLAILHLQAGQAGPGLAPFKLTSGPLLTAPEVGALEFLNDDLYFTKTTGTTRQKIAFTNPRVATITDQPAAAINCDTTDQFQLTAIANNTTFTVTGTPFAGQKLIIRLKDAGAAKSLTWNAVFRAINVTLPVTTVISKTMYVGCIYNTTDSKWDVITIVQEA